MLKPNRKIKQVLLACTCIFFCGSLNAQKFALSVGTDIPYQHYVGLNLETNRVAFSLKSGVLVPPYSDIILNIIEASGTDPIYVDLLNSAYQFGWMNSFGAYYRMGNHRSWYVGPEVRVDQITASDTPSALIETLTGQQIRRNPSSIRNQSESELGLIMYAAGFRFGHKTALSQNNKHFLNIEISAYKYMSTNTTLFINGTKADNLNAIIDDLLWEDVFKKYGYIGGIGVSYQFVF
jgi:hypothetical protein